MINFIVYTYKLWSFRDFLYLYNTIQEKKTYLSICNFLAWLQSMTQSWKSYMIAKTVGSMGKSPIVLCHCNSYTDSYSIMDFFFLLWMQIHNKNVWSCTYAHVFIHEHFFLLQRFFYAQNHITSLLKTKIKLKLC